MHFLPEHKGIVQSDNEIFFLHNMHFLPDHKEILQNLTSFTTTEKLQNVKTAHICIGFITFIFCTFLAMVTNKQSYGMHLMDIQNLKNFPVPPQG